MCFFAAGMQFFYANNESYLINDTFFDSLLERHLGRADLVAANLCGLPAFWTLN
jgi:hypothetical protein